MASFQTMIQQMLNYTGDMPTLQRSAKQEKLSLSEVLDALRDATRREIVLRLSKSAGLCSSFADLGPKTRLSYHFAQLRKAGLTDTEKRGTCRLISLRKKKIDEAFPGLLQAVLRNVRATE